jgi:hypothetical protein
MSTGPAQAQHRNLFGFSRVLLEGRNKMSKMRLNPIIESVCGKFGELVFRNINGKQTITRLPDMTNVV